MPNPRQARWALFFTQFHFTVTYHPGTKANALSRIHAPDQSTHLPETHSPSSHRRQSHPMGS